MIHLRGQYYAVEVPDLIENVNFYRINGNSIMVEWDVVGKPLNPFTCKKVGEYYGNLYDYKWPVVVCTSKEATKEQAYNIVEHEWDGFKDYGEVDLSLVPYVSPIDSLKSLLTSKGCDINKNWLILKKL